MRRVDARWGESSGRSPIGRRFYRLFPVGRSHLTAPIGWSEVFGRPLDARGFLNGTSCCCECDLVSDRLAGHTAAGPYGLRLGLLCDPAGCAGRRIGRSRSRFHRPPAPQWPRPGALPSNVGRRPVPNSEQVQEARHMLHDSWTACQVVRLFKVSESSLDRALM